MTSKEILSSLITQLNTLKNNGSTNVSIDSLHDFIFSISPDEEQAQDRELSLRLQHERELEFFRANLTSNQEMFRSIISTAQSALRATLIISGGAAAGMLTFLGNFFHEMFFYPKSIYLVFALAFFGFSCLFAAVGTATTYLAQNAYYLNQGENTNYLLSGLFWKHITISIIGVSYILFSIAVFMACSFFYYYLV